MKKLFALALGILLGLSTLGCNQTTTTTTAGLDYDMFFSITDYSQVFNRNQGTYIVYMYSDTCAHCVAIKSTVLEFADTNDDIVMYFFNVSTGTEAAQTAFLTTVGLTTSNFGTPTLIVVVDNDFDLTSRSNFLFEGEIPITSILRDIENDAYAYIK